MVPKSSVRACWDIWKWHGVLGEGVMIEVLEKDAEAREGVARQGHVGRRWDIWKWHRVLGEDVMIEVLEKDAEVREWVARVVWAEL